MKKHILLLFIITLAGLHCKDNKPQPAKFMPASKLSESFIKNVPAEFLKKSTAIIKTSLGDIKIKLFNAKAPISVKNFLTYVYNKHYDNTIFHRVIPNFMIQGGGFKENMRKTATLPAIKNEATNMIQNSRGTVAMARTPMINSATTQFFINLKDNAFLNHRETSTRGYGYAVFAEVTAGLDVVDKIAQVKTGKCQHYSNCPSTPVTIISIVAE